MRPLPLLFTLALLLPAAAVASAPPPSHPSARIPTAGVHRHAAPPPVDEAREELEAEERPASGEVEDVGEEGELEASGAWSVQDPPAGFDDLFEIPLDVTEGTWLSLDVSPDGEHVVFDLLGDLYAVPIAGGAARSLTSGLAWDMQPAFSPDGRWIAFTSDRGGGDNLWLLPWSLDAAADAEPVQVTKEDFRLVNSPAWSPDGRFLAARKHFTSERSLGAGEI